MDTVVASLAQLTALAGQLAQDIQPKSTGATLVTLSGELGAGKTAFVKALAAHLGVQEEVTSPTFILARMYPLTGNTFTTLIHIDAYRLDDGTGLAPLRFNELLQDPKNLIVLEWPEQVADALPQADRVLTFTVKEDGVRHIRYE